MESDENITMKHRIPVITLEFLFFEYFISVVVNIKSIFLNEILPIQEKTSIITKCFDLVY